MVKIHSYEIYSKQLKDKLTSVKNSKSLLEQKPVRIRQSKLQTERSMRSCSKEKTFIGRKGWAWGSGRGQKVIAIA